MNLSPRQLEIISLVAKGHTTKSAAKIMGIHYETAKDHLERARWRLDAKNMSHLTAIAAAKGLIGQCAAS